MAEMPKNKKNRNNYKNNCPQNLIHYKLQNKKVQVNSYTKIRQKREKEEKGTVLNSTLVEFGTHF